MKVVKFVGTLLLQIILIIAVAGLGVMVSSKELISVEKVSENIQKIDITEIMVDEKGEPTKTGAQVYDLMKHANISQKDADVLMNDGQFKAIIGDFVSSASLHQIDETVDIVYPSESAITDVIYNNYDALKESYQIDKDKSEVTKERILEEVRKNYGSIRAKLQEYAESLGE